MKQIHPAIKLVNDCIKWFSKPGRYVKNGVRYYEFNTNQEVCRTCLLGAVTYLNKNSLTGNPFDKTRGFVVRLLDKVVPVNGYVKHYTSPEAQAFFKKTKKLVVKALKEKGEI